jgi:hypothetical protein
MTKRLNDSHGLTDAFGALTNRAASHGWSLYQIFGLNVASDYPFSDWLSVGEDQMDLLYCCQTNPPIQIDWDAQEPISASPNLVSVF